MTTEECYNDSLKTFSIFLTEDEMIKKRKEFEDKYNIRQEKDGRYRAVFFVDGCKHDIRRVKKEKLIEELHKIISGETTTIRSIWDSFLIRSTEQGKRKGTIENYKKAFKNYISRTHLCDIPLVKITPKDIEDFCLECIALKPIKKRYWKELKGTVSQVFVFASYRGITYANPTRGIKVNDNLFVQATHKKDTKKYFSQTEKEQVQKTALEYGKRLQDSRYLGISLTFCLGVRAAELCALKWGDIEENTIHIQREVIDHGKGIIDSTKTPAGNRFLTLNSKALALLESIRQLNQIKGYSSNDSDFLFHADDGTYAKPNQFDKKIRKIEKKLNFEEIKSMHDIRRTFATEAYKDSGGNIVKVQALMGHSTTAQTYAYIMDDPTYDAELMEKIG